jgi:predicted NUDIX family phosphoesterase
MSQKILTIAYPHAPPLPESGCWPITDWGLFQIAQWRLRSEVENDESLLQPVVYLVLLNAARQAWCYQRSGGDHRVMDRWSCGVGGHVDEEDRIDEAGISASGMQATLSRALQREVSEELGDVTRHLSHLRLHGLIYEGLSAIGRSHIGVLYTAEWRSSTPPKPRADESLHPLGFINLDRIASDPRFELWSRLAVQHLSMTTDTP